MQRIKTIKYAIIDDDNVLLKVGSSHRPATFKTLKKAEERLKDFSKYGGNAHLVEVWCTPYKSYIAPK